MLESVDPLTEEPFNDDGSSALPDSIAETKQQGQNEEKDEPKTEKLSLEPPEPEVTSLWAERRKLGIMCGAVYLLIFLAFVGILSIYWGSLYHREFRVKNMQMLAVVEDLDFSTTNSTTFQGLLGEAFANMLQSSTATSIGTWTIGNATEYKAAAAKANITVFEEITQRVHKQEYWAGFYINSTASQLAYDLLISGNALSAEAARLQSVVNVVYESGRHFSALSQYVSKNLRKLEVTWLAEYALRQGFAPMVQYYLTPAQRNLTLPAVNSTSVLSALPQFNLVDYRPSFSSVVLGPSELGLVYALVFSFHQFNFSSDLHANISGKLRFRHYLLYRILFSQANHFVLLLVYSLMTIALQVPVHIAYGRGGFMVLWMTMYMFFSACGGINENAATVILAFDKKVLLPVWMIFTLVLNISPTFAPFVLMPGFYRYGYALPMYNTFEALKVLFFNTWKGHLARNYGILVLWIGLSNILLCFVLHWVSTRAKKQAEVKKAMAESESPEK